MTHTLRLLACAAALALGTGTASAQYYQAYPIYPAPTYAANNCDVYARNYANQVTRPGGRILGGAAVGALTGAGIGAIVGGPNSIRRGAAIGAASGAFIGAVGNNWNVAYRNAYNNCVHNMAYQAPPPVAYYPPPYAVPPQNYGRPYPAWSQAWFSYCTSRFRSFNQQTGYYLGFDGQYHFCQG